ncbi:hypothetical protein [Pedobacter mendelii]|uniref:Uncharacterized protein n=1 Tax=Pedobacter mendelii TaxID=1908240 RepID=A0ABQ2BKK1_9SPHI|nr:hypothetical protein [Pedobacter mendelii]GGI28377.1 hypothetical protein GCM10008119_32350 [Pedobacter mendelii]
MATDLKYIKLFNSCTISQVKSVEISQIVDDKILNNKSRYTAVKNKLLNLTEYNFRSICFVTEPDDFFLKRNPKIGNSFFSRTFLDNSVFSESSGINQYTKAIV